VGIPHRINRRTNEVEQNAQMCGWVETKMNNFLRYPKTLLGFRYKDLCLGTLNIVTYFEIDYLKNDYTVLSSRE